MSSRRGDRRADLVARHQRDVVDREDVRRVGHRHGERAVAAEGDGDRLVALGRGAREQVGRGHVDLEDVQVEVVEAVALGDGARELLGRQVAAASSTCSGVVPDGRAVSIACSTRSLGARPSSTITSVRKRGPPRRREARDPVPGPACDGRRASAPSVGGRVGRRWGTLGVLMSGTDGPRRRAHHVDGAGRPGPGLEAQRALADQDLQAIHHRAPSLRAAARSGCRRPGRPGPPRTRTRRASAPSGRSLSVASASPRPTAVQFTSRSAGGVVRRARRGRRRAPRRARGAVPDRDVGGPGVAQRPGGGARAAARAEDERGAAAGRLGERREQARRVGVVGADRPVRLEASACWPRRSRPRRRRRVRERERGLLVRDRDVRARGSRRRQRPDGLGQQLGRDRQELVAPRGRQPERLQRRVVHRGRAAVGDRPAEDAGRLRRTGSALRRVLARRAPRACGCRRRRRGRTAPWSTRSCGRRSRRG